MTPLRSSLVTLAALLPAACVSEPDPLLRGAAGFTVEPNAAARGELFVTDDGWSVRLDRFFLQAAVSPPDNIAADGDVVLWNGAMTISIFAPGIPTGQSEIHLSYRPGHERANREDLLITTIGVDEEVRIRFAGTADDAQPDWSNPGPAVAFRVRAERAGRTVMMALALRSDAGSVPRGLGRPLPQDGLPPAFVDVDVPTDALTLVPFALRGEKLVRRLDETKLAFDPFVAADEAGNADGVITVDELRAMMSVPYAQDLGHPYARPTLSLLEDLQLRCANLLRP